MNGTVDWQCCRRHKTVNCLATVKQNGEVFTPGPSQQCYPAEPGTTQVHKIRAAVVEIRAALNNVFRSAGQIVSKALWDHHEDVPMPSLPTPTHLAWRSMKGAASWWPPTPNCNSYMTASTGIWTVPSSWFMTPSTSSSPSMASCSRATAANKFPFSTASCLGRRCTRRSSRLSWSSSEANRRWRGWPWILRSGCGRLWRRR